MDTIYIRAQRGRSNRSQISANTSSSHYLPPRSERNCLHDDLDSSLPLLTIYTFCPIIYTASISSTRSKEKQSKISQLHARESGRLLLQAKLYENNIRTFPYDQQARRTLELTRAILITNVSYITTMLSRKQDQGSCFQASEQ